MGQHPLISRILKGAKPRYETTWDVAQVLRWMETPLRTYLISLPCLTRPMRSSDLAQLDLRFRRYLPEGGRLAKQDRPGKVSSSSRNFFFPKFDQKPAYEKATSVVRMSNGEQKLLLAVVKPHIPIAPSSVARWIKVALQKSGVNVSIFKGHSTRAASAVSAGITVAAL